MTTRRFVAATVVVCLTLAGIVSGFASSHPDGLEFVAHAHGFADTARDSVTAGSPLADYAVAGIGASRLSGGLAGVLGCALTFGLVVAVTRRRPVEA